MTAHFAGVAFALLTAGAAVLIVAGLAREGHHGKGRHLHLFPDLAEPTKRPIAKVPARIETPAKPVTTPVSPRPRADVSRKAKAKKSRRRKEKRRERRAKRSIPAPEAEQGDRGSS